MGNYNTMRYKLPSIATQKNVNVKSKLPRGICQRCKKKKNIALFMGKAVCSDSCYHELNYRRKCPFACKRDNERRGNKYAKFDKSIFKDY